MPRDVEILVARLAAGFVDPPTCLFIDESGDRKTGHDGDYFVFAVVATEDPESLRRAVKKTKGALGITWEVKNKDLKPDERKAFLTAIAATDCRVLPYVVHKPSLRTMHFEKGGQKAYKAHLANAVRNAAVKTSQRRTTFTGPCVPLICYPDPIVQVKKDPSPVDNLLKFVLRNTDINAEISGVVHNPSSQEQGLQAADIVAGSIFYRLGKRYEFGTILDPIRHLVEVDLWSVFPKTEAALKLLLSLL